MSSNLLLVWLVGLSIYIKFVGNSKRQTNKKVNDAIYLRVEVVWNISRKSGLSIWLDQDPNMFATLVKTAK